MLMLRDIRPDARDARIAKLRDLLLASRMRNARLSEQLEMSAPERLGASEQELRSQVAHYREEVIRLHRKLDELRFELAAAR